MFQEREGKQEVRDTLKTEYKVGKPKKGRVFKKKQVVNQECSEGSVKVTMGQIPGDLRRQFQDCGAEGGKGNSY